jgi:hypothetical protein
MMNVPYGWLFRLMHAVGSNLIVIAVGSHMLSVFFMNSYKKPRELTWFSGASMLLITLTFCLSGYLLPWSQLSYWATTIVTNIPSAIPFFGAITVKCLQGGQSVSGITLGRFFALHVVVMPLLLLAFMSLHTRQKDVMPQPRQGRRKMVDLIPAEDHPGATRFSRLRAERNLHGDGILRADVFNPYFRTGPLHDGRREYPRGPVQDAGAHQAGMVFPGPLPDAETGPEQVAGHQPAGLHGRAVFPVALFRR